jgi:hypothetical protein
VTGRVAVAFDFFAAVGALGRLSDGNASTGIESRGSAVFDAGGACLSAATVGVT